MKRNLILTAAALVTITTLGCRTQTVNTTERNESVAQRNYIQDKRVITDGSLDRTVGIVGIDLAPASADQHLKVQVELQNTKRKVKTFSYRWEWFDQNGQIVRSPVSNARTRQIEGRESIFLTGIAPTPQARDFRLKLIEQVRD